MMILKDEVKIKKKKVAIVFSFRYGVRMAYLWSCLEFLIDIYLFIY